MGFFRASPPREARGTFESPTLPLTSTTLLDWLRGPKALSGVNVTETSALGMPSVWRATALIAGSAASLPLHAYREEDDRRIRAGGQSQAVALLADPHMDMTPFEFWELVYVHMLLWGNAYCRILRNGLDQVVELWPLHPSQVKAGRASDDNTKVYEVAGDDRPHSDETILHFPGMGYDGVCGCSPIRVARQSFGLALAAEEYGARLFGSGSLASGILQTEQRLTQEQADALKARWKERASGLANAHDVAVLDRGAKFEKLTIPPEDAQFIESRKFQVVEVARMFGVPPHMLMDVERSTSWGTGIEQQSLGFVRWTLRPWLTRVEQRMTKLVRPASVYIRYNLEGLLRGDAAARSAFYKTMWEIGALSTNDIRALEEMDPVEGGDVRYRPMNMGILGQAPAEEQEPGEQQEEQQEARV